MALGVRVDMLKPMTEVKSETIQARDPSVEKRICRGLKPPLPRLYVFRALWGSGGHPGPIDPVVTTSMEGESTTTAPVPFGICATRVGLLAAMVCWEL